MKANILEAIRGLTPMPVSERSKYKISHLEVGGYFNFNNENFKVLTVCKYLEVNWENFSRLDEDEYTYEICCFSLKTGKRIYFEYFEDDELEIFITDKEIKLRDLNITQKDLEDIVEQEEGEIKYNGRAYFYDEDETSAALYFRKEDEGIPVRFYEFYSGDTSLTIEIWGNSNDGRPDREAFISSQVDDSEIEILQLK